MQIQKLHEGAIALLLDPGECLLIADCCDLAADALHDRDTMRESRAAHLLAGHFKALALAADAGGRMAPGQHEGFTLDGVRAMWRATEIIGGGA